MTTQALIERALGIRLGSSPVYTAKDLLVSLYQGKERTIRDTTFDLRDLPFMESALDIVFRRDLEPWMIGKTIHHFDKNSAYLSACSSTNTGIGDPEHVTENIVFGLPGIYRVTFSNNMSPFDGEFLPAIIERGQEWVTNDVLVFAQQRGYTFTIHEAWVFKNYDRILGNRDEKRNWAKKIWDARVALKEVDREAYEQMKVVALVGLGSFATGKDKYSGLHLIHPNWWADVVGKTRVNMLVNLEKYAGSGAPLLVYADSVWFVRKDPNYRSAVPGILDRMDKLGGFKHVGTSFTLTEEIYEMAQYLNDSEMVTLFKKVEGLA